MLNLSLIRHAKSDWNHGIHDDMSRPISLKGINRTKKICELIKEKKMIFDEVFCSPSKRTKETLDIIVKNLPCQPSVHYLENLYHTSSFDIFDTVMLEAKKRLEDYRKSYPVGSDFLVGINIGPNKDSKDRFNDYKVLSENLSIFGKVINLLSTKILLLKKRFVFGIKAN